MAIPLLGAVAKPKRLLADKAYERSPGAYDKPDRDIDKIWRRN
jgi:hypothetical protein